jgi:general secretion pathway protein L
MIASPVLSMASRRRTSRHWAAWPLGMLAAAGRWWVREFLALFPERVSEWLLDRGLKSVVLAPDADGVTLRLLSDRGRLLATTTMKRADFLPASVDDFLQSQGLSRGQVLLGLRLAPACVFGRQLLLPQQAERSLASVVVQDLALRTPFRLDDIYHDHVARRQADKISVRQWIVRRQFVDDAARDLGMDLSDIAFLDCSDQYGEIESLASLARLRLKQLDKRSHPVSLTLCVLALSAVVLTGLILGNRYRQQEEQLDRLAAEIMRVRPVAHQVRTALDRLAQEQTNVSNLRAKKRNEAGLLDVWEEVTRVMPLGSWLTELRLSERPDGQGREMTMGHLEKLPLVISLRI